MKETVVGIFLFIAMLVLILLTYHADDEQKIFGRQPTASYRARFSSVAGLCENDPVYLSGIKVGRITSTEFVDADGVTLVEVKFNVEKRYPVRQDTQARIQMTSLMGGKMLSLSPGRPESPPLEEGTLIPTHDTLDIDSLIASASQALSSVGGVVDDIRPSLAKTMGNLERITGGIDPEKVKDIVGNIQGAAENFRQTAEKINTGEGTIARLVNDAEMGAEVKSAVADLATAVRDACEVLAGVSRGEGAVGVLLKDEETAQRVKDIVAGIRDVSVRLSEGQGTLGLLINEPDLYNDLSAAMKDISAVTAKLTTTEGTLGAIINDPGLYLEIKRLLSETREAIEDAREQAPLSAFGSLIFGAIQ